ncbi:hypothetical protein BH10BAC5_BH10BAC5_12050 [soil metagenome]
MFVVAKIVRPVDGTIAIFDFKGDTYFNKIIFFVSEKLFVSSL